MRVISPVVLCVFCLNLFLDTSALVKLYHNEDGTDNLLALLQQSSDLTLTISDLAVVEFYSAIFTGGPREELEYQTAQQVFDTLEHDVDSMYVIEIDGEIKQVAQRTFEANSPQKESSYLDALQLSPAIAANDLVVIDCFVASDKHLPELL